MNIQYRTVVLLALLVMPMRSLSLETSYFPTDTGADMHAAASVEASDNKASKQTLSVAKAGTDSLRVLTYNVFDGFDWRRDTQREQATADWIESMAPDIVAFQELNGFTEATLLEFARTYGHDYAVMLKEDGYPVGVTSRRPIEVKSRLREGLWHGMLHVVTYGIDLFVVHLSPADVEYRMREARILSEYMRDVLPEEGGLYLVAGDFNAHSPFDAHVLQQRNDYLNMLQRSTGQSAHTNLRENRFFDFSVMSIFLGYPLIDIHERTVAPEARFTFPTPILISQWRESFDHVVRTRIRIDYMLASTELAEDLLEATIINYGEPDRLSDHYPLMAVFRMNTID